MDQLIFASLSHTHYWYEVGMLKIPADVPNGKVGECGDWPSLTGDGAAKRVDHMNFSGASEVVTTTMVEMRMF